MRAGEMVLATSGKLPPVLEPELRVEEPPLLDVKPVLAVLPELEALPEVLEPLVEAVEEVEEVDPEVPELVLVAEEELEETPLAVLTPLDDVAPVLVEATALDPLELLAPVVPVALVPEVAVDEVVVDEVVVDEVVVDEVVLEVVGEALGGVKHPLPAAKIKMQRSRLISRRRV
jgi:hypothetical protein